MPDYNQWADEYVSNAKETMKLIEEYKAKRKAVRGNISLLDFYNKKIDSLTDMYYDCMISADRLRRKAARIRKRMGGD